MEPLLYRPPPVSPVGGGGLRVGGHGRRLGGHGRRLGGGLAGTGAGGPGAGREAVGPRTPVLGVTGLRLVPLRSRRLPHRLPPHAPPAGARRSAAWNRYSIAAAAALSQQPPLNRRANGRCPSCARRRD